MVISRLGEPLNVNQLWAQTADSDNNVFGRVLNPHKLSLTAGGSSGGEGALVAMRGSILGVGTDIGGSIRIPALCCGTYGFKPSSNRIPYSGQQGPGKAGSPGIKAAAGPLATTFRDLEYFTKLVLSKSPWNYDSSTMAIPWRVTTAKERLVIGVQADEPIHPLYPPAARALSSAVKKLEVAGYSIIYLKDAPSAADALKLASHFFSLDNTKQWLKNINASGEPLVPQWSAIRTWSMRSQMDITWKNSLISTSREPSISISGTRSGLRTNSMWSSVLAIRTQHLHTTLMARLLSQPCGTLWM